MPADPDCHGTPKPISGDRNRDGVLDPNEKWVYQWKVTLNGTGLYRNRATVEAVDEAGGKVDAQAQAEVQVGARANIVPNVIGLTEENAVQVIREAGLTSQKEGSKESGFGVGLVCEQSPEAGQSVSAGTKVGFWITSNAPKYLYLDR